MQMTDTAIAADVKHAADQEKHAAVLRREQQEPWLRQWHSQLEHLAVLDPVHGHGMRGADVGHLQGASGHMLW